MSERIGGVHRVHVPDAAPPSVRLPAAEGQHLTRVLRLGAGAEIVVFDGRGGEWTARIAQIAREGVDVDLIAPRSPVAEPGVAVTLAMCLLKGDLMDAVVRDATMLGVAAIVPVVSARTVVPGRAREARATERWSRIAAASAKQCGRAVVPEVGAVRPLDVLLAQPFDGIRIACVEPALGEGIADSEPARPFAAQLLVGPEGGWSPDEVHAFHTRRVVPLSLGPRTLRADAAPIVALTALWTRWGWT
jgi:16S rRNA (uracil1498-N3)-methyltransferase